MCGLAALVDYHDPTRIDLSRLKAMTDAIAHRGPDGEGHERRGGVALGHRRLSIIDLEGGHQPMASIDDRYVVVFNGEIYNFQDLAKDLEARGSRFKSRSDTEVILEAWRHHGPDCVRHLDGMFVFLLYDKEAETFFAARDRMGKKPLYYTTLPTGQTAFASELKALQVLPELDRTLNDKAVEDYFALGYIPDPKSIYRNTFKLPGAHRLVWKRGGTMQIDRYWDPNLSPLATDAATAREQMIERLGKATRGRMISDVPLGAFLSGGVDSSAVVSLMAEASREPVKTFSIGFGDTPFDETAYARAVAERYHTDHTVNQVNPDDFSLVDRLIDMFDEPFGDSSALPTFRVSEAARARVTVALSGDGGDELFGGYRRHYYHVQGERLRRRIPHGLRKAVFGPLGRHYPKLDRAPQFLRARTTFQEIASDELWGYFNGVSATADEVRAGFFSDTLKKNLQGYHASETMRPHFERANGADPLARAQYVDLQTWLSGGILVKVDRTSMATSLEVRAPLLDHHLAEWALRLPSDIKLSGRNGKAVLKSAMEDRLPHDILYRPKQGFSMPLAAWFRGPLRGAVEAMTGSGPLLDTGFFDRDAVGRLAADHLDGRRDHARTLWLFFMFQRFLEREAGATVPSQAKPASIRQRG